MTDKRSPYYVRSEFYKSLSGDEKSTTFERSLTVKGNDRENIKNTAPYVEAGVM